MGWEADPTRWRDGRVVGVLEVITARGLYECTRCVRIRVSLVWASCGLFRVNWVADA